MSQVFREASIPWQGQELVFVPSAALLRRIKGLGINNMELARQCIHGGADPLDMAVVLRAFLGAAGVQAGDDECYAYMTSGDAEGIAKIQMAYISAVLPSIDLEKKPEAPTQSPAKPRAKKKRAT